MASRRRVVTWIQAGFMPYLQHHLMWRFLADLWNGYVFISAGPFCDSSRCLRCWLSYRFSMRISTAADGIQCRPVNRFVDKNICWIPQLDMNWISLVFQPWFEMGILAPWRQKTFLSCASCTCLFVCLITMSKIMNKTIFSFASISRSPMYFLLLRKRNPSPTCQSYDSPQWQWDSWW